MQAMKLESVLVSSSSPYDLGLNARVPTLNIGDMAMNSQFKT